MQARRVEVERPARGAELGERREDVVVGVEQRDVLPPLAQAAHQRRDVLLDRTPVAKTVDEDDHARAASSTASASCTRGALPRELGGALETAPTQVVGQAVLAAQATQRSCERVDIARPAEQRGVADELGDRRRVRRDDGRAARHRLEHLKAEALVEARVEERVGAAVVLHELARPTRARRAARRPPPRRTRRRRPAARRPRARRRSPSACRRVGRSSRCAARVPSVAPAGREALVEARVQRSSGRDVANRVRGRLRARQDDGRATEAPPPEQRRDGVAPALPRPSADAPVLLDPMRRRLEHPDHEPSRPGEGQPLRPREQHVDLPRRTCEPELLPRERRPDRRRASRAPRAAPPDAARRPRARIAPSSASARTVPRCTRAMPFPSAATEVASMPSRITAAPTGRASARAGPRRACVGLRRSDASSARRASASSPAS